jgi:hypothetical protein
MLTIIKTSYSICSIENEQNGCNGNQKARWFTGTYSVQETYPHKVTPSPSQKHAVLTTLINWAETTKQIKLSRYTPWRRMGGEEV